MFESLTSVTSVELQPVIAIGLFRRIVQKDLQIINQMNNVGFPVCPFFSFFPFGSCGKNL